MKSASCLLVAALAVAAHTSGAAAIVDAAPGDKFAAANLTAFHAKLDILLAKLEEAKNAPKNFLADFTDKKVAEDQDVERVAEDKYMAFKNATTTKALEVMHALDKKPE